jgi:hypothetical protein
VPPTARTPVDLEYAHENLGSGSQNSFYDLTQPCVAHIHPRTEVHHTITSDIKDYQEGVFLSLLESQTPKKSFVKSQQPGSFVPFPRRCSCMLVQFAAAPATWYLTSGVTFARVFPNEGNSTE